MASPFDASGIQYAWDSVSFGWLKECPRKYYYSMIRGLRGKGESPHLTFGLHYHSALEHFDKLRFAGQDTAEATRTVLRTLLTVTKDWHSDHDKKNRESLVRSVLWYLDEYFIDPAQTHRLANGSPAVELSFRFEVNSGKFLCGHIDRLVEFQDALYVMDRKTTSMQPSAAFYDSFNPDGQMSGYSLAARVVYESPVKGIIIDAAQIGIGFTRFGRGLTYRTDAQLDEWLNDFGFWTAKVPEYLDRGWPMNDKACNNYGGCPFRPLCSKDPRVREQFVESNYVVHHWNPLEPR